MQRESKTQHRLVMWFNNNWIEHDSLFFTVNNDTFSAKDAQYKKAMGLKRGVSDLILILPNKSGKIAGIEVKGQGSVHTKDHIEEQLAWGLQVINSGGFYLMSSSEGAIKGFIQCLMCEQYERATEIQKLSYMNIKGHIEGKKTIIF